jgi:phytoene dehydrogenase-like protein
MASGLSRRGCLRLLATAAAGVLGPWGSRHSDGAIPPIPGDFADQDLLAGHAVRQKHEWDSFSPSGPMYDAIVVGGGIAGLSACWKLKSAGVERILLLELGQSLGGTARASGGDPTFPWGAHYINVPPAEADCVHEVLLDLGVIQSYDAAGRPVVDPQYLLRWPHERLHVDGQWIEGLEPYAGLSAVQREPLLRFEDEMLKWALYRGRDGRRAFSMPMLYSSSDEKVRQLDSLTMAAYLDQLGLNDQRLRWMVDYACLDDYGSRADQISAWAAIHYFSCRFYDYRVRDSYPTDTLTWPAGNGFLVERLAAGMDAAQIRLGAACLKVRTEKNHIEVGCLQGGHLARFRSRTMVYAAKLHTCPYVFGELTTAQEKAMRELTYTPWMVAALRVRDWDEPAVWDNVFYDSASLGYIMADHQGKVGSERVLLYYLPLPDKGERRQLLEGGHRYWTERVMGDLLRFHPELANKVSRIDFHRWGHAMIRPQPGLLWGRDSFERRRPSNGVFFAGCDATGLPLFEEACFSGISAAEGAMRRLGVDFKTSLAGLPREYRL